ncbi:GNAT family N-acetyltransferase [Tepidamorphus sp. 3E244]|uniref:GNAT family N-acetyltransferase n=1 Tax=Tepidamorphus sp. 3E244 TaxID=3385498 RepID=UPI0038FCA669
MGGSDEADSLFDGGKCCPDRIVTKRLIMRRPTMADAAAITAKANNADVARWLSRMPYPYAQEDAKRWIEWVTNPQTGECAFVICLAETGEVIGACGLEAMPDLELPQVGYWLGEPHWGKGYATEAVQALIDYVFGNTGCDAIGVGCRVANVGSRRVIEKCGFQYAGLDMMDSRFEGAVVPVFSFKLTRRIWESLKAWAAA